MHEFWYDYVNLKDCENAKLYYMDTNSFMVHVKKQMIFPKTVQKMLKQSLILQIMNQTDPCPKRKIEKVIGLTKDELGGPIMKEFAGLKAKTYSCLKENNEKDKKTQKSVIKIKLKFQDYRNCLEAARVENEISHLEKSETDEDSLTGDKKEFIKNKKLILKTEQRFKNEKDNVFTEEIKSIALSSNDNKIMQSINSTETYTHRTSKDLVCKKEEIKCNNKINQYIIF